ncbi:MAG: hypothetical protein DMG01_18065 [Acidobacteria bacterium]|nr:MAG: hypothetical protein DMG01_18065 [Acidobacteriota bacterium]PYR03802.1 MAG: hypothetical protein DMG00_25365 [Acidobacteriota bacterium]
MNNDRIDFISSYCGGEEDDDDPVQNDWNGSAKIALISLERSEAAWRVIAQATSHEEAGSLADAARDLRRLTLEKFPRAMSFIRPGFDEPWRCAPPSPSPELASRESAAR